MTKQWEQYEATIRALYADHTLSTVRQIMIEQHGFNASVRAYRGRLDRWKVRKYNRRNRNGSVSSGSGSDDASSSTMVPSAPAPSRDVDKTVPALTDNTIQDGWNRSEAAHRHHSASANVAAGNHPYPYATSQYAQKRYCEDKAQLSSSPSQLSSSLQPPGYQNACYWTHAQGPPHHPTLGNQVSAAAAAATTAAAAGNSSAINTNTTVTAADGTAIIPYYENYAPVTQPVNSWPPAGVYAAAAHAEPGGDFGFGHGHGHHHDQRIGTPDHGHVEMPFLSTGLHGSPPGFGSGAQDGRHRGANAGEDARRYEVALQNPPERGGPRH